MIAVELSVFNKGTESIKLEEGLDIFTEQNDNRINYESGQLLHAYKLTLRHPITNEEMTFEAPLPNHFNEAMNMLKESHK